MRFNQRMSFNYYHQLGLFLALSSTITHYSGANILYIYSFSVLFMLYFLAKISYQNNLLHLLNVINRHKVETGCYIIFLLSPYVGNLITAGTLYDDTSMTFVESLFRLMFFFFLLLIGTSKYCGGIWKYFLLFFAIVYVYFILAALITPSMKFSNSSGVCVVLGAIYFHSIFKGKARFLLFLFTAFFLYDVMISRALALSYIVFHVYMKYEHIFKYGLKKYLLLVLSVIFLSTIFLFIYIDNLSSELGVLSHITSGRGEIWSHYIASTLENGSIVFGVGHSKGAFYSSIPYLYDGPMKVLEKVMIMGGVHNSYIYTFSSRGLFGIIAMFFFVNYFLKKQLIRGNEVNIGLFLVSALMFFSTGQSTLGGFTFESQLMLMSLLIPFREFLYSSKA